MNELKMKLRPLHWGIGLMALGVSTSLILWPFTYREFCKFFGNDAVLLKEIPMMVGVSMFGIGLLAFLWNRFVTQNLSQWHILWLGFVLLVLSGLFPPHGDNYIDYEFVLEGGSPIRYGILFIEWVIIAAGTGIAAAQSAKRRNPE